MTNNTALSAFEQVALQKQVEELQAKLAMQDEALCDCIGVLDAYSTQSQTAKTVSAIAGEAISATPADVAAWQEKRDKEVEAKAVFAYLEKQMQRDYTGFLNRDLANTLPELFCRMHGEYAAELRGETK